MALDVRSPQSSEGSSMDHLAGVDHIESGESFTVDSRKQMIVHQEQKVEGLLTVQGTLVILGTYT